MKRCQIAAKIAGSIVFLPRCVLNDFFTSALGYECLPESAASLSHHNYVWEIP